MAVELKNNDIQNPVPKKFYDLVSGIAKYIDETDKKAEESEDR